MATEKRTKYNVESLFSRLIDRKISLVDDLKTAIIDLITDYGEEKGLDIVLKVENPHNETIHFLNADNEHLEITPTLVYHNIFDEIGVYGKEGSYNQEDFEDVQFYFELLMMMINSVFHGADATE